MLIEYNGMWQLKTLYDNMPENWAVYQEFMFADATTFLTYNANMRGLVVDKLSGCELVVFNRFTKDMDKMAFHKIVRGISRARTSPTSTRTATSNTMRSKIRCRLTSTRRS